MIHGLGVVVPAADEERVLPRCLAALRRACEHVSTLRPDVLVRVVVVLDGCTDGSAAVVARHDSEFADLQAVTVDVRQAGRARRAGCSTLLRGIDDPRGWWIASTDADSEVPVDWLSGMLELADADADLVLGTVQPARALPARVRRAYEASYVTAEGHRHVHGANLGVRATSYLAMGGWPELGTGEDVALAACAEAAGGLHIVRTARFPVRTSTRLVARAPHGYAAYLRALALTAELPIRPDPDQPPASRAV